MIIKRPADIPSSEITPERAYLRRREFLETAGLGGLGALALAAGMRTQFGGRMASLFAATPQGDEKPNSYEEITSYNNYYEFGTDKVDPKANSGAFKPKPWSIQVDGLCAKPGSWTYEDLIKPHKIEDRTYRLRCVEAWSMVIPWQGIPLGDILKRFEPSAGAKYVAFTTVMRPKEMPGQNYGILPWPYVEGLRMDEATHPLTILATGLYGKPLPNQNGAPIRLIVPWKYGFKGIKSIVRISFTAKEPTTTWNIVTPNEYGFYANVNPDVDHPRWTQASERRIGEFRRRRTLMFNGYGDQVASMYAGMDLRKNY